MEVLSDCEDHWKLEQVENSEQSHIIEIIAYIKTEIHRKPIRKKL